MPETDITSSWLDELLSGHRASGIAAAASVWTPASRITRWTTPDGGAQEPSFLAYSITKTFIACLVLQLADAGRLDLDAPVNRVWQGWPLPDAVTTRRLLNHTAGLPDYGGLASYQAEVRLHPGQPWHVDQFIQATLAQPWSVPEPTRFAYSNPGYMVLRLMLDAVGRSPWQAQLAERVCQPLGLTRTTVAEALADLQPLAPGLSRLISDSDERLDVRGRYHPGWVSHGVVASTASDITTFMHALFTGRLLTPDSLTAMGDALPVGQVGGRWHTPAYGLGLMIDPGLPLGPVWGHNGGGPGYSASSFGLWRDGCLQGIVTSMVGGGRHDEAELLTFGVLSRLG
jgi:D-alanyl-D-alanine carboxypeptidase